MILTINNLNISFLKNKHYSQVVRHLNLQINSGEILGLVGESGSGKSLTNLAIMGLLPKFAKIEATKFYFKNHNLLNLTPKDWRALRGREIAMIFQDAKSAMNPSMKIKAQLIESIKRNKPGSSETDMKNCAMQLLDQVRLTSSKRILENYPHELSGGMAQRVMIAMALATQPSLLIADEPTTGLDLVNKKQILNLLNEIRLENNMAVIIVSHDINLIRAHTDKIAIMYSGELMEAGPTQSVMNKPIHPYTQGLINCLPKSNSQNHSKYLNAIKGLVLPITEQVDGCRFYNRCPQAQLKCLSKKQLMRPIGADGTYVNCYLEEIA